MIISLFMPLVLLVTLQYFIFFSEGGKTAKIISSSKVLLSALKFLKVFRVSIPVNPSFSLGDSYGISILIAVLCTVVDAFAFPKEDDVYYTKTNEIAHYTLIGIASLYPGWVVLRTLRLYRRYR
jgi:hypothetical protein